MLFRSILEHFTVQDGLPDMKIESIFEDSRGVLWFGTHDRGIVRYEGNEMVSSLSLPNFSRKGGPFLHRPYVIG